MKNMSYRFTARWWAVMAVALLVCSAGADRAWAQRFESIFGGTPCVESGRGGVQQVSSGGYIAAGQSYSPSGNCASSDIYVVRTRNDGLQGWSMTYNIGGNDSATSIREVVNDPNGRGGFIVTGVTDMISSISKCLPSRNIFLLRIDSCGRVIWARTYGSTSADEIAWDVIETRTGDATLGTQRGDFVVAGSVTVQSHSTTQLRNGYLLRVRGGTSTTAGAVIWDRTYNSPLGQDDYFYSLDECTVGVAAGRAGDIVAAGGTNGYGPIFTPVIPSYDGWLVRVGGNDGKFSTVAPQPQGAAAYGGRGAEEFRSVVELRTGAYAGNIVAVGQTSSVGGGGEAYLLQTGANVCKYVSDRTLGDHCGGADAALWVREISLKFSPGVPTPIGGVLEPALDTLTPIPLVSHIIVTGYVTPPTTLGFGGNDVFLQEFATGTLNPIAPTTTIYGSTGNDWGWSVNTVRAVAGCTTAGYIIGGFTQNRLDATTIDREQLYLIKTDRAKSSGCEMRWTAPSIQPEFPSQCELPRLDSIKITCRAPITTVCRVWQRRICFNADSTQLCRLPLCPLCAIIDTAIIDTLIPIDDEEPLGKGISSFAPGTVRMDDAMLGAYPNPIREGADLMLEYTLQSNLPVTITVTDLSGRVVYSSTAPDGEGTSLVPVSTEGWASGAYTVTMNAGGKLTSRKVVVKN